MAAGLQSWRFRKKHLITSVTHVQFWRNFVLAGIGPYLDVFKISTGEQLVHKHLLGSVRIHGIRVEGIEESLLVLYGEKDMRAVHLKQDIAKICVEPVTDIVSFPDLIWDAHWLYDGAGKPDGVSIATAHNAVWHWSWEKNISTRVAQCQEVCILYSARFLGSCLSDLILASGTVFNQVILWKVQGKQSEDGRTEVLHRLTGHQGVIFSINFSKAGNLMCSVSDDRSIRLWKVKASFLSISEAKVEPFLLVYGHTARVWDAQLLEKCFVSIGEDSTCIVWSYSGTVIKKFKGHIGRNIWTLAVNDSENLLATGGGDGSVRLWPLPCPEEDPSNKVVSMTTTLPGMSDFLATSGSILKNKKLDFPRLLAVLHGAEMLVMTNEGCIHKLNWKERTLEQCNSERNSPVAHGSVEGGADGLSWRFILQDRSFSSYSVMALSPCRKLVAFGNLLGSIKVHDIDFVCAPVEAKPYDGKVLNISWSSHGAPQNLFTCGPEGIMIWWRIRRGDEDRKALTMVALHSFRLPPSKQRWASAVEIVPVFSTRNSNERHQLICGDRKGTVHLFEVPKGAATDQALDPVHSLSVLHGRIGVTDVCAGPDGQLYSAGRDGVYRRYGICQSKLQVLDTKKVYKGLEWLERLIFTPGGDLVIAAFHTSFFLLWSVQRNELLMKVECGGGHRAWDLFFQHSPDSRSCHVVFAYLKGAQVHTERVVLQNNLEQPVLKPSFHGREVTCMCYVGRVPGTTSVAIATGSEDTNINLMSYDYSSGRLTKLFTAQGHISSVRTLCTAECPTGRQARDAGKAVTSRPVSSDHLTSVTTTSGIPESRAVYSCRYLLFSGGGRASLKCWRVDLSAAHVSDSSHDNMVASSPVLFLAEYYERCSKFKRRRLKKKDRALSEIRFMSLTSLCLERFCDSSEFGRCLLFYVVVAACSDGFVRIFGFDEERCQFSLVAQSQYLKRCVLTVDHVIHQATNEKPQLLVIAGDTAGKISMWNITPEVKRYLERTLRAHSSHCGEIRDEESELDALNERAAALSAVHGPKAEAAHHHVTDHVRDCHVTDREEESFADTNSGQSHASTRADLEEDAPGRSHHGNGSDGSSNGAEAEDLPPVLPPTVSRCAESVVEEARAISCMRLVEDFLASPVHVFQAHQSGVNCACLVASKDPGRYLLVSGGDDSALFAAEFSIRADESDVTDIHLTHVTSLPSAHFSSVTGIKVFQDGTLISTSVDQRLKVWTLSFSEEAEDRRGNFIRETVEFVDIPDVQALEVWRTSGECFAVIVCGLGIQTLHLSHGQGT